jgi:hypothetical protein
VPEPAVRLSVRARFALGITLLAPVLAAAGLHLPGRTLVALAFVLLVPGVALVELLRLPSQHVSWCLAIAVSLAVNLLVAQAQLTVHGWRPLAGQMLVALSSLVLLALALRRGRADRVPLTDDVKAPR